MNASENTPDNASKRAPTSQSGGQSGRPSAIDSVHTEFDPNSTARAESGVFGLPFSADEAKLHLLAVPWEVTTSYGRGASLGPDAVLRASRQVDLFDLETGDAWKIGYMMDPINGEWFERGLRLKEMALERLELIEAGEESGESAERLRKEINDSSTELNQWVEREALKKLRAGKLVGLVGGDHSTPYGLISALKQIHGAGFGILHIDAHADLRTAYQGYDFSHASIMHNVIERLGPAKLVQIGIRDFSIAEFMYGEAKKPQIQTYYDRQLKKRLENGETWTAIARGVIAELPQKIYVSFDIDGLDPALCPNTGTPVPGGLSFDQAVSLLVAIADAGKQIIGFDLNEVAEPVPGGAEWDANVGARMLFKLCGWCAVTNGLAERRN